MKPKCKNCWFWEYHHSDDGGYRYGRCGVTLIGADEAYPSSEMLLVLEGPSNCRQVVSPQLLTGEKHYCSMFQEQT